MTHLEQVFNEVEHSSDKWQPYFEVYERHLKHFQFSVNPITLVEVGVQKGGSLEMWANYFTIPENKIIGIDVDPECKKLSYKKSNIRVEIGDQGSEAFWDGFLAAIPSIDIFIDDGGHYMNQQITTFEKVFPKLNMGGVYICEDCHTSYMRHNGGGYKVPSSFIEYSKSMIDTLHFDWKEELDTEWERKTKLINGLTSVHFYDSVVVYEKFGKRDMKRVQPSKIS